MLDLQTYMLYELYQARCREVAAEEARRVIPRRSLTSRLTARLLAALGNGLVTSGSVLKRRYEPVATAPAPKPQVTKRAA